MLTTWQPEWVPGRDTLCLGSLGNKDTGSGMEHEPARNNAGAIPLFCCSVILKYLTSIHSLKKLLERGRNCLVCIRLLKAGQVNDCLFILREASDGFSPNSNRQCFHHWTWHDMHHTELGGGTGLEQVRNWLLWPQREPNYLTTAIYQLYSLQCPLGLVETNQAWSGYSAQNIRHSPSNIENHGIYFTA